MLRDNSNNQNAIRVKRILDKKIGCSTYNLRICFLNESVKEHDSIEACLKEMKEKLSPEAQAEPFMQECMKEFKEKLEIYDRFFRELSRRDINGIE